MIRFSKQHVKRLFGEETQDESALFCGAPDFQTGSRLNLYNKFKRIHTPKMIDLNAIRLVL